MTRLLLAVTLACGLLAGLVTPGLAKGGHGRWSSGPAASGGWNPGHGHGQASGAPQESPTAVPGPADGEHGHGHHAHSLVQEAVSILPAAGTDSGTGQTDSLPPGQAKKAMAAWVPPGQAKKLADTARQAAHAVQQAVTNPPAPAPAPVVTTPAAAPAPVAAPTPAAPAVSTPAPAPARPGHRAGVRRHARRLSHATRPAGRRAAVALGPALPAPVAGAGATPASRTAVGPRRRHRHAAAPAPSRVPPILVTRVIHDVERVIPTPVIAIIAVLMLVAAASGLRGRWAWLRARRLDGERRVLLDDIGSLQRALLPDVPGDLGALEASVAYRPADGPAAGGDFYDVVELGGGRTALVVGDVCGHGREALSASALMRYTLRTYLTAGWSPRVAVQLAGRALQSDPAAELTTVVVAVHDARAGTLAYACAGHEPPIVLGPAAHEPVTVCSSPPLGGFMATGRRQTTIGLPPGSTVCLFTDGLVETQGADRGAGRARIVELLEEFGAGPEVAQALLDRAAAEASHTPDDMAACVVRADGGDPGASPARVEELVADAGELDHPRVAGFLEACGVDGERAAEALSAARAIAARQRAAILRVTVAGGSRVEVLGPGTFGAPGAAAELATV